MRVRLVSILATTMLGCLAGGPALVDVGEIRDLQACISADPAELEAAALQNSGVDWRVPAGTTRAVRLRGSDLAALRTVTWRSSNESVAGFAESSASGASVHARAAGEARLDLAVVFSVGSGNLLSFGLRVCEGRFAANLVRRVIVVP